MRSGDVLPRLEVVPRAEFIENRFAYHTGEHVTFIALTQSGKTTLAYDLMNRVSTVKCPAVSLVMKPRDRTVSALAKRYDHEVVRNWPIPFSVWRKKRTGYVVWPKHTGDFEADDAKHSGIFRKTMRDCYFKKKPYILFADETVSLVKELGLSKVCAGLWTKGSSMDCGFWGATQRPFDIPLYAYNASTHLFLAYEPDKRNRDRLGEIGGVNSDLVKHTVANLSEFQWLYIRKKGKNSAAMCVIDK
jgi:hypothetical protein